MSLEILTIISIISIPSSIKISDANIINCPCCNELLLKEVKEGSYLIEKCTDCFDRDRSQFGTTSYSYDDYINRNVPCTCEYGSKEFLFITCNNCKNPKCISCDELLNIHALFVKNPKKCAKCNSIQNNLEFNAKFSTLSIEGKLKVHGIEKLKILAKKKNIKNYSTFNKDDLIIMLIPLTNINDFPIIKV